MINLGITIFHIFLLSFEEKLHKKKSETFLECKFSWKPYTVVEILERLKNGFQVLGLYFLKVLPYARE